MFYSNVRLGLTLLFIAVLSFAHTQTPPATIPGVLHHTPSSSSPQKQLSTFDSWTVATYSVWNEVLAQWDEGFRMTTIRDGQGRSIETLNQIIGNGNWGNFSLINVFYDLNGVTDSLLQMEWDGSAWQNSRKQITTRDANGLVVYQMESLWNDALNAYEPSNGVRNTYTLNSNQQIISHEREVLNPGTNFMWENLQRITNIYAANMELDTVLIENFTNGAYAPWRRSIYLDWEDFSQYLWDEAVYQEFDQGSFSNYARVTNVRNGLTRTSTGYDWVNNGWVESNKTARTIDSQGCEDLTESFLFQNGSYSFVSGEDFISTYNANGEAIEVINRTANTDSIYFTRYKWEYTIPAVGRISPTKDLEDLIVYPNPFSQELHITGDLTRLARLSVVIMDAYGRTIESQSLKANPGHFHHLLDLPSLPSGIYHYSISDGGSSISGKLIRQ